MVDSTTIYEIADALDPHNTSKIKKVPVPEMRRIRSILVRLGWIRGKQDADGRVKWHRPKNKLNGAGYHDDDGAPF
jgi:hypothetical protein